MALDVCRSCTVVKQLIPQIPMHQLMNTLIPRPRQLRSLRRVVLGRLEVNALALRHACQQPPRQRLVNHRRAGRQGLPSTQRALVVGF